MKRLLSIGLALVMLITLGWADTSLAGYTLYVQGGWLRMREQPSFDAKTIASFYTGTPLEMLGSSGYWYYMRAANGKTGYMYSAYLTATPPSTPVVPTGSKIGYVTSPNGRGVRLRQGPGTNYGVIGLYNVGTKVTILSQGAYWHYIQIGKQTGYMMAQYISPTGGGGGGIIPPVVTPYTAYVTAANGRPVNLRSGPGQGYQSLALLPVGTQVTVLQHNATWDRIRVNSLEGYMMNKFLTRNVTPTPVTPVTLVGVSVSTNNPTVNQTLSAVTSPAGATVSCQWFNEQGTLLSNATTYTVKNTDYGRRLRVVATGMGNTSGSATSAWTQPVTYGAPVTNQLTNITLSTMNPISGQMITATALPSGATATYTWYRDDWSPVSNSASYQVQASDVGRRLYCVANGTGSYTGTVASGFTNPVISGTVPTQALMGTVSLPNATTVGTTLIPSMTLNSYNVNYSWQANGVVVGTGNTLYISETYLGADIRLTVTAAAASGYEGSISSGYCIVQSFSGGSGSGGITWVSSPDTLVEAITP